MSTGILVSNLFLMTSHCCVISNYVVGSVSNGLRIITDSPLSTLFHRSFFLRPLWPHGRISPVLHFFFIWSDQCLRISWHYSLFHFHRYLKLTPSNTVIHPPCLISYLFIIYFSFFHLIIFHVCLNLPRSPAAVVSDETYSTRPSWSQNSATKYRVPIG